MSNIQIYPNGFLRENEDSRATFDHLALSDWESIGHGEVLSDEVSNPPNVRVTEVGIVEDGYIQDFHFDKEFLAEIEMHMHEGAKKYGRDNWRLAQDTGRTLNSIIRHALQAHFGCRKENHAAAIATNALILWNTLRKESK